MRIRFTIRRLLIVMLVAAPILALFGASYRKSQRNARRLQRVVEFQSKFQKQLSGMNLRQIDDWKLSSSTARKNIGRRTCITELIYSNRSGRAIVVEIRGVTNAAFVEPEMYGYRHRSSRTEMLMVQSVGEVEVNCADLFAETLDETKQRVVVYGFNRQWKATRRTSDEPFCRIRIDASPWGKAWENHYTDPALLQFAATFVEEVHRAVYGETAQQASVPAAN